MYQEIDADMNAKRFRSIWELAMEQLCQHTASPETEGVLQQIVRLCDEAGTIRYAIRATYTGGEVLWLTDDNSSDEGRGFSSFHTKHLVTFVTREEAQSRVAWMSGWTQLDVIPVVEVRTPA